MKPCLVFMFIFLWISVTESHFVTSNDSSDDKDSEKKPKFHGRKGWKRRHRPRPVDSYEDDDDDTNSGPRPNPGGKQCQNDWLTFDRPQGRWCVKVFVGQVSHLTAETQCRALGATLTGLQNDKERMDLAEAGRKIMLQNNFQDAAIWLGGMRKGHCQYQNMCLPKETFFWTDNHTTGTDGFHWAMAQPSGGGWRADFGVQSCIHQFIFASGSTFPSWPNINHGELDDLHCQESTTSPAHKLYACGKKP